MAIRNVYFSSLEQKSLCDNYLRRIRAKTCMSNGAIILWALMNMESQIQEGKIDPENL